MTSNQSHIKDFTTKTIYQQNTSHHIKHLRPDMVLTFKLYTYDLCAYTYKRTNQPPVFLNKDFIFHLVLGKYKFICA